MILGVEEVKPPTGGFAPKPLLTIHQSDLLSDPNLSPVGT